MNKIELTDDEINALVVAINGARCLEFLTSGNANKEINYDIEVLEGVEKKLFATPRDDAGLVWVKMRGCETYQALSAFGIYTVFNSGNIWKSQFVSYATGRTTVLTRDSGELSIAKAAAEAHYKSLKDN